MTSLERANPSGKVGRLSKSLNDMFAPIIYLAIKDILRARAADFVDSAHSGEVVYIDMLQNLSQNINGDSEHGGNVEVKKMSRVTVISASCCDMRDMILYGAVVAIAVFHVKVNHLKNL